VWRASFLEQPVSLWLCACAVLQGHVFDDGEWSAAARVQLQSQA